jgi:hypothetical protein
MGVSTSASFETGSGLTSLVASAGMLAHDSSGVSSRLGRAASVSATPGQPLWCMATFERREMSMVCK